MIIPCQYRQSLKAAKSVLFAAITLILSFISINSFSAKKINKLNVTDTNVVAKNNFNPLFTYLAKTIRYPRGARETSTTGTVIAGFKLNADGVIEDVVILQRLKKDCEDEVKAALTGFKNTDKTIKSGDYKIAFTFKMEGQPALQGIDPELKKDPAYLTEMVITAMRMTGIRRY